MHVIEAQVFIGKAPQHEGDTSAGELFLHSFFNGSTQEDLARVAMRLEDYVVAERVNAEKGVTVRVRFNLNPPPGIFGTP